ncbi:hypothetical protein LNKW23_03940 [Paralimibaculum aggregatum]|uniref:Uncharacterized protein n=1 Tax=Paralimibaculum aggregatum TaxID=3036245 RepID=A0ABQ6LCT4_9RHOB|nr:hypothetical protein LNKW23_03940 [Limibaculum sp. NKW23]
MPPARRPGPRGTAGARRRRQPRPGAGGPRPARRTLPPGAKAGTAGGDTLRRDHGARTVVRPRTGHRQRGATADRSAEPSGAAAPVSSGASDIAGARNAPSAAGRSGRRDHQNHAGWSGAPDQSAGIASDRRQIGAFGDRGAERRGAGAPASRKVPDLAGDRDVLRAAGGSGRRDRQNRAGLERHPRTGAGIAVARWQVGATGDRGAESSGAAAPVSGRASDLAGIGELLGAAGGSFSREQQNRVGRSGAPGESAGIAVESAGTRPRRSR